VKPDKRIVTTLCRAHDGCLMCVTELLAHYCLDHDLDAAEVSKLAVATGMVEGDVHEEFILECITERIKQIVSPKH